MVGVPPKKRKRGVRVELSPHHHGERGLPKFSQPFSYTIAAHAGNKSLPVVSEVHANNDEASEDKRVSMICSIPCALAKDTLLVLPTISKLSYWERIARPLIKQTRQYQSTVLNHSPYIGTFSCSTCCNFSLSDSCCNSAYSLWVDCCRFW